MNEFNQAQKKNQGLLVFVKNLEEGKVKTRLAATMGHKKALEIYRSLLSSTANNICGVVADKIVFYSEYIAYDDLWNNFTFKKQVQQGDDLGRRMFNAFNSTFCLGYDKLAIIGSDCPELNAGLIELAFKKLDDVDVVIGPAVDGGYYLLALKSIHENLFKNVAWSTNQVLSQTLKTCDQLQLSTFLLDELSDIDVESDLIRHPWLQ